MTLQNHLPDATKMMADLVTCCFTKLDGALNLVQEVLPAGVAQRILQISDNPEFHIDRDRMVLYQGIELALHLKNEFFVHKSVVILKGEYLLLRPQLI